jgi:leader peptidase (prepilin peptidase)/N-methyltransferase
MEFWPSLAVIICLFFGFIVLLWHTAVDLKLRLLPDELNIALAALGLAFHWMAYPHSGTWLYVAMGALLGAGSLALVRAVANRVYGFETMGLGDVKLMGAAGIWLGPEGILYALMAGALSGVLHGLGMIAVARRGGDDTLKFREMTVPAGPGFCFGILCVAIWQFHTLPFFGGLS